MPRLKYPATTRYVVVFDRHGDEDVVAPYLPPEAGIAQLARELQEAYDSGCLDGRFRVVSRETLSYEDSLLSESDTSSRLARDRAVESIRNHGSHR